MKLNEFRLYTYEERELLQLVLQQFRRQYPDCEKEGVATLLLRLSRTECQDGGCPYCNADRAREESERRDAEDEYYRQKDAYNLAADMAVNEMLLKKQ